MQEQSRRAAGGADKSRQSLAARFELSVHCLGSVCSAQCALSSVCSVWQCAQLSVHCSSQRALSSVHTSVQCLGTLSLVCRVWAALLPPSTAAEVELSMPALHSRPKELAWWKWLPWKWLTWKWLTWRTGLTRKSSLDENGSLKMAHLKEVSPLKEIAGRKGFTEKACLKKGARSKEHTWRKWLVRKIL